VHSSTADLFGIIVDTLSVETKPKLRFTIYFVI